MHEIISLVVGYFLGALPFAVWIARSKGIDIFKVGSGNAGATNVKRSVGKKEGDLCFALDAAKGLVAVLFAVWLFGAGWAPALALVGAILGHSFPLWTGFKGGKGVAVTIGGALALMPVVMVIGLVIWVVLFYTLRYVSLASIVMALWLPVGALVFAKPLPVMIVATLIAIAVIVRHHSNIGRLIKGTESKFDSKKK